MIVPMSHLGLWNHSWEGSYVEYAFETLISDAWKPMQVKNWLRLLGLTETLAHLGMAHALILTSMPCSIHYIGRAWLKIWISFALLVWFLIHAFIVHIIIHKLLQRFWFVSNHKLAIVKLHSRHLVAWFTSLLIILVCCFCLHRFLWMPYYVAC